MNPIAVLRRYFANVERSRQMLEEIREGVANLTDVTNRHLVKLIEIMEAASADARRTDVEHWQVPVASRGAPSDPSRRRAPSEAL